jgi:Fur family iron response transcriptional regulator
VHPVSQVSRPGVGLLEGQADHMAACPVHALRGRLRRVGLRPTRQRVALGWLLFGKGDRHITAEKLYEEATGARVAISLATVYNTLHQFTEAGLLREIAVDGSKTYFDTNTTPHHHFLIEETNTVLDIPGSQVSIGDLPEPPEGMEIERVEVVVRLRKKKIPRRAVSALAS